METKKSEIGTIVGGLAFVVLLLVGFLVVGRWKPERPAAASVPVTSPGFQLGEIAAVKNPDALVIAVTPEAGAAAERYEWARDEDGMRELRQARLVSYQGGGGLVRITGFDADPEKTRRLGCETTWIQVRRIDGRYEGSGGWVDATCLKRR